MKSAQNTKLKKLIVAVPSSELLTPLALRMQRMPDVMWPRSAGSTGGSSGEIERSVSAETTNETASTTSAMGAEKACTRAPPTLGPATNEKARLPCSSEPASRYRSRGTSETNSVEYET